MLSSLTGYMDHGHRPPHYVSPASMDRGCEPTPVILLLILLLLLLSLSLSVSPPMSRWSPT